MPPLVDKKIILKLQNNAYTTDKHFLGKQAPGTQLSLVHASNGGNPNKPVSLSTVECEGMVSTAQFSNENVPCNVQHMYTGKLIQITLTLSMCYQMTPHISHTHLSTRNRNIDLLK